MRHATEPLSIRYLPILRISSSICFASSRVGVRQSACGTFSSDATLSIPRTKHAVFPVPLCDPSRLRPDLRQRRRLDLRRPHELHLVRRLQQVLQQRGLRVVERGDGDRCSASFELLLSSRGPSPPHAAPSYSPPPRRPHVLRRRRQHRGDRVGPGAARRELGGRHRAAGVGHRVRSTSDAHVRGRSRVARSSRCASIWGRRPPTAAAARRPDPSTEGEVPMSAS